MRDYKLKVSLEGLSDESGHLRVNQFTAFVDCFARVFKRVDSLVTGQKNSIYLRIVDLSHNSPAMLVLEAKPSKETNDQRSAVFTRFVGIFEDITNGKDIGLVDYELLKDLKELVRPIGKSIQSARVSTDGKVFDITQAFQARVDLTVAEEETFPGEITGVLEYLNVHGGTRIFKIYPDIGPSQIDCYFSDELKSLAKEAILRYIGVSGTLTQKRAALFPHKIDVEEINIFPGEEELPNLSDFIGSAPNATGGMTSEEFIWSIRSGEA